MSEAKTGPIYGNWKMFSPAGELMCRMEEKRANWYLKRNLAHITAEHTIQLNFTPNGNGNAGIAAMIEDKYNRCVVCGEHKGLNRHHVVPYQYRKHFPIAQKARTSYDIVPLCLEDHEKYETIAQLLSIELSILYNVPNNQAIKLESWELDLCSALKKASALLIKDIPENKVATLQQHVMDYLQRTEQLDDYELEEFVKTPRPRNRAPASCHGQLLVKRVLELGKLQDFIITWREHFVETMKPQFLSPNWTTNFVLSR